MNAFVDFSAAQVLSIDYRTSKAGNQWCLLAFLDTKSYKVYEVPVFGESVALCLGVTQGSFKHLVFDVLPDRNGGVRLELSGMGACEDLGGEGM